MIAIVDGCGANIASVQFALERVDKKSVLTTDAAIIKAASHVILPGVGTAQHAMQQLAKFNLIDTLRKLIQPVLGICLGMQLLFDYSQEGEVACLEIIPGIIAPITSSSDLIIPHMGWNQLQLSNSKSALFQDVPDQSYMYFVHSYVAPITEATLATANYGESFSAAVQSRNFYGTQFHPERSGEMGELILRNFVNL